MKKRNTLVGPQLQLPGNGINWHRGWFLLLPIAIGMVAATQFAAHSLYYDRALGPNFYRLYPPWGFFRLVRSVEPHQSPSVLKGGRSRCSRDSRFSPIACHGDASDHVSGEPVLARFRSLGR